MLLFDDVDGSLIEADDVDRQFNVGSFVILTLLGGVDEPKVKEYDSGCSNPVRATVKGVDDCEVNEDTEGGVMAVLP